jgi:hypothetical protein
LEDNPLDIENIKEKQLEDNDLQQSVIRHPELGAALEKSLRKNIFKPIFFSMQSCMVDMVCRMNIHQDRF